MLRRLSLGASILTCLALAGHAHAQAGPSPSPAAPAPAAPTNPGEGSTPTVTNSNGGATVTIVQAPSGGTTYGPVNPNAGLPSSSQARSGNERDSFDLGGGSKGPSVVYGTAGSAGVLVPQRPLEVPS